MHCKRKRVPDPINLPAVKPTYMENEIISVTLPEATRFVKLCCGIVTPVSINQYSRPQSYKYPKTIAGMAVNLAFDFAQSIVSPISSSTTNRSGQAKGKPLPSS